MTISCLDTILQRNYVQENEHFMFGYNFTKELQENDHFMFGYNFKLRNYRKINISCLDTILQRNYRKITISWSFSYNSFVKFYGTKIGSHTMTALYQSSC